MITAPMLDDAVTLSKRTSVWLHSYTRQGIDYTCNKSDYVPSAGRTPFFRSIVSKMYTSTAQQYKAEGHGQTPARFAVNTPAQLSLCL